MMENEAARAEVLICLPNDYSSAADAGAAAASAVREHANMIHGGFFCSAPQADWWLHAPRRG